MTNSNFGFEILVALGINDTKSKNNIESYLKQFKDLKIDLDVNVGDIKSSSKNFSELEKTITSLNNEVNRLTRELESISKNVDTNKVSKSFDDLNRKASTLSTSLSNIGKKASLGNSIEGFNKEALKSFNNLKELYDYLDTKQIKFKIHQGTENEVTKVVATIKNELNQLETVTIKPRFGFDKESFESVKISSIIDDSATFKLNEALNSSINKLEELRLKGTLTGEQVEQYLGRLNLSTSNQQISDLTNEFSRLASWTERFDKEVKNVNSAISALERTGEATESSISNMRAKLSDIPTGDLGKVKSLLEEIQAESDRISHKSGIEKALQNAEIEVQKLNSQLIKTQNLYKNSFDINQAKALEDTLNKIRGQIEGISKTKVELVSDKHLSDLNTALKQTNVQIKDFNAQATTSVRNSIGTLDALKQAYSKFPIWMLASTSFYTTIRGIQDLTEKVIELDTAMISLQRVADGSQFEFDSVIERSIGLTDELSGKVSEVSELVTEFARMGNTIDESFDLAKTAQTLVNISDLNAEQAVNSLTAARIAFGKSAEESMRIADSLNEVDNSFSITTLDLSNSLRKASSTAATFNVTMDEMIGHTTAI